MVKVSTKSAALLAALLLLGTTAYSQSPIWPLKGEIDLSSGYGDFRAGRFHVGLDLRTGGQVGAKVFAPVDGWVWRVKMSYRGYGKGLYFKGTDNHLYVFGHLSGFSDAVENAVKNEQFRSQRYYVDVAFPKDSLPVKKGQLIAFSGQSGVGGPHLHFEERTSDNVPLDPLLHGFALDDKIPPTFERLGIHLLDNHSLFSQGRRTMFLPVRKIARGRFSVDRVPALSASFGFVVDGFDQMRPGGMRQAINKLTLLIDSVPYYESELDSLPFDIGAAVALVFDNDEAADGEKRVRRTYRPVPQESIWPEARAAYGGRSPGLCAYGTDSPPRPGVHRALVVGEDAAGNKSELSFSFEYVEPGSKKSLVSEPSFELPDNAKPELTDYSITEEGIIAQIKVGGVSRYWFFPPRSPHESLIDPHDLQSLGLQSQIEDRGATLDVVGWDGGRVISSKDQRCLLTVPKGSLFKAQFVTVGTVLEPRSTERLLRSKVYDVKPQTLPMRGQFEIAVKLDSGSVTNRQTGLCWCTEQGSGWSWIDNGKMDDDAAVGTASGGGLYAAVLDTTAPTIAGLSIKQGRKYLSRRPDMTFRVKDNLSGFEDDRSIDVRIDGQWLLPELDIETGRCIATLKGPLDIGQHRLSISVVDRAGNRTERQVEFEVVKQSKR